MIQGKDSSTKSQETRKEKDTTCCVAEGKASLEEKAKEFGKMTKRLCLCMHVCVCVVCVHTNGEAYMYVVTLTRMCLNIVRANVNFGFFLSH